MKENKSAEKMVSLNLDDLEQVTGGIDHPVYYDQENGMYMICPNCRQKTLVSLPKEKQIKVLGYDTGKASVAYCTECGYTDTNPNFGTDMRGGSPTMHA